MSMRCGSNVVCIVDDEREQDGAREGVCVCVCVRACMCERGTHTHTQHHTYTHTHKHTARERERREGREEKRERREREHVLFQCLRWHSTEQYHACLHDEHCFDAGSPQSAQPPVCPDILADLATNTLPLSAPPATYHATQNFWGTVYCTVQYPDMVQSRL